MNEQQRMNPVDRKRQLLGHALLVSREHGYRNITRKQISDHGGVSATLITKYFGTVSNLRRAIMGEALRLGDLEIIAQGLVAKDPRAEKISDELRKKALEKLMSVK